MNRNLKELKKQELKMRVRNFLPNWFLKLIRRRQVPLIKMQKFLKEFGDKRLMGPTRAETIAVIIPCYNHSEYLPLAFESATSQTHGPNQIILIDDNSSDNTHQVIKNLVSTYQKNNPTNQIEFLIEKNKKNLGQALTINKAVDLAKTDLVMILNDDDYLMHDAVETMLYLFKKNPNLALIGGDMISFDSNDFLAKQNKQIKNIFDPTQVKLLITDPEEALGFEDFSCLHITHTGSTFSREKAISSGLYRKNNRIVRFSDRDFQIRINLLYPVGTTDKIPFCFWRNNSSVDSGLNS